MDWDDDGSVVFAGRIQIIKVKVKAALEQAIKAQRGSRNIIIIFL